VTVRRRIARFVNHWRGFPAEARRAYRVGGMTELRQAVAERSVHLLFRRDRMVIIADPLDAFREVAVPPGVTITVARSSDWGLMSGMASARDIELFRNRQIQGRTCLIAWRDARPIGYTWFSERMGPDVTACTIPLPSHAAYLYDLYVTPSERGTGVGSALVTARLNAARERGFTEGWRMISVGNGASLRTAEKTASEGTRVVGELTYFKVLDRMYPRFTPRVEDTQ
jgi:GNAT superfamily N-acetyltransferase